MIDRMKEDFKQALKELGEQGLAKVERVITTAQGAEISVLSGKRVLNFCSNNYLGLSNHPELIEASYQAMKRWGFGLSSVRFICGTQQIHVELEKRLSQFLRTEDTILYAACFDANGGLFEPLLGDQDVIISDELNHASIIDGVRLCKAGRLRYRHSDLGDLERCLREAKSSRYRLICTDGVFSMDGDIAHLGGICDLAEKYDSLIMVDDSHATGYIGETGRGTAEHCGVEGRIDIVTTTFGKALGGASGGCTSGRKEIIDMLRQKSRPYLFSNTLSPAIAGAALKALELLSKSLGLRERIRSNAGYFRAGMKRAGFNILPGETAIIPVMIYEEPPAVEMAERLLSEGIYVVGFTYPVVPRGKARIRVQLSASHTREHLDRALDAFVRVGKELGLIS